MSGAWRMTKPKTGDVQSPSKMKVTRYHQQVIGQNVMWNHLLVPWHRLQTVRYEVLITVQGYLKADGWSRGCREWVQTPLGKIICWPLPQARANQPKINTLNRKDWLSVPVTRIWSERVDLHNQQIMTTTKKEPNVHCHLNRLTPNDPYMGRRPIYGSYHTANLQTLHFIYLFNKYRYWIF